MKISRKYSRCSGGDLNRKGHGSLTARAVLLGHAMYHDCRHLLRIRRCYVLLIRPTVELCAGKVRLTNDPHFTFGWDAICSEFLSDERILILPAGGGFISKMKHHKTPSRYQITHSNSQWRVQNTFYMNIPAYDVTIDKCCNSNGSLRTAWDVQPMRYGSYFNGCKSSLDETLKWFAYLPTDVASATTRNLISQTNFK
jgi:hypothetical protein